VPPQAASPVSTIADASARCEIVSMLQLLRVTRVSAFKQTFKQTFNQTFNQTFKGTVNGAFNQASE
jgi:hypothetical protein